MNVASLDKLTKIGEGSCATSRDLTAPAVGQVRGRMQARIGEHFSTAAQRVFGAKVRRYAESLPTDNARNIVRNRVPRAASDRACRNPEIFMTARPVLLPLVLPSHTTARIPTRLAKTIADF